MSISAASPLAEGRPIRSRRGPAWEAFARAWRSLTWRHWLIAVGVGIIFGIVNGTFLFLYFRMEGLSILLNVWTRWVVLMTGVACALAYAVALLRDRSRRAAIRPRDVVLTIVVVSAFGSLIVEPIAIAVNHAAGGHFAEGADWLTLLSLAYGQSGEKIVTFVTTVSLSAVYYFKDSRTSDALAVAQLGLAQTQKRRLTEELRSAQAALDPDFLFATLDEIDRRFDSEPQVAQHLLDAVIRFLRAALPANGEAIGTLGQQATLLRAYLEIESIRSAGRLQGDIDLPSELESRLFAPALILPLVVLAAGDAVDAGRDTEIVVKASLANGRLIVEVGGDGRERGPTAEQEKTLASLRHRVGALYGSRAELFFATSSRGSTAKIVIDDPGDL